MKTEKDFKEFLRLLNKHKVKYCIVGAFAVGFYGYPRYSKDMDMLVEPIPENAKKILKVLKDFGFGSLKLKESDFTAKNNIIQLGIEPVRIDIKMSLLGVSFSKIWNTKVPGRYGKVKIFFIGKQQLIKSKKANKRQIDLIDVEKLKLIK